MKKLIAASIATTLLLSPVAAYASQTTAPVPVTDFRVAADTAVQKADIQAFTEIKAQFDAATVDIAKVKADYVAKFQTKVKALIPDTDALIIAVLDGAAKGDYSNGQAKQAVDKGLQGYFYAEISNLTKVVAKEALTAGKKEEAAFAVDKAVELYNGSLKGTATKRDAGLGTNIVEQMDTIIIPALFKAAENGNVTDYNVARQMFDKSLIKVFTLATITYAEKVPKLVAENKLEDAKVGLTEGYFFFLPIFNSFSGGHKASAELIKASFGSGDPAKLDTAQLKDAFTQILIGKTTNYANKVIAADLSKEDALATAKEAAMEGNMFISVAETLLTEKLGKDGYKKLTESGQLYFNAVAKADKAEATKHLYPVLTTLSTVNGINFEVGASKLVVNGKDVKIDAPSMIKNGRTLVPARALAEALGGKIEAVKADGKTKVVIEKDGSKVEFFIGGTEITQDGKKLETVLDQPALIEKGRTFIPVRAVSTVFGKKVFFSGKTIIVLN
ncbi:copper amine oxidase N-terminal domain-containing protein [Brevibacillus dissolubilis]|uniref:copper amine oxidase N-terminal domain-containing protein n=1 Tax=Brevibacillus dissolubilis TaxID=1844116 RepID=UPI0011169DF5|nr:copper amine oxidase N-terminal domain-containing protein [Brevibacillus dissolubilis]